MNVDKIEYMENSHGALVPRGLVKEIDILRNEVVMEIVEKSEQVNAILTNFKIQSMDAITAFVEISAEKYSVKKGGKKGNITLFSFDGRYKVVKSINEYIVFDERLQVAKDLIDDCVKEWSNGSTDEIKVMVNYAFQVDKTGKISTERILGLRRLDIAHEKWLKAMDAISESIQVTGSKAYIRVYKRDKGEKYTLINLDLAAI